MTQALGVNSLRWSQHGWMTLPQLQAPGTYAPSQEKEMKGRRGGILELIGFDLEQTELHSEGTRVGLEVTGWLALLSSVPEGPRYFSECLRMCCEIRTCCTHS